MADQCSEFCPRWSHGGCDRRGSKAEKRTNHDNVSANRTRAAAHCFEKKCFGVLYLDASNIKAVSFASSDAKYVSETLEGSSIEPLCS